MVRPSNVSIKCKSSTGVNVANATTVGMLLVCTAVAKLLQ